jgi:hypothetical protein
MPHVVIAGLDPAIHPLRKTLAKVMDARVKPAHDDLGMTAAGDGPVWTDSWLDSSPLLIRLRPPSNFKESTAKPLLVAQRQT